MHGKIEPTSDVHTVHIPECPARLSACFLAAGMAYTQPVVPMAPPLVSQLDDHGAGTVGVVGGPLSQLLEQNYAILNQFKQNMEVYKVNENTELLVRFRDNILTVLNQMNAMQVNISFLSQLCIFTCQSWLEIARRCCHLVEPNCVMSHLSVLLALQLQD